MRVGKVKITLQVLEKLGFLNKKILIAYPDNKILNGWVGDQDKFNIRLKNVTYTNFSSLKKFIDENFDFIVIDEPQELSENEFDCVKQINTEYLLYLTGTATDYVMDQCEQLYIKTILTYSKEQAIKDNIVADYKLTIHLVDLDNTEKIYINKKGNKLTEKQKFDTYSYVIDKNKLEGKDNMHLILARNRISQNSIAKNKIVKHLLKHLKDKRVLVFTGLTKQAESLDIPYYHTKCKDDSNIHRFNNREFNHLAMANAGRVGTNYEDLDSIILSNFVGDDASNRQLLDRTAKLDYHNKVADLHIICLNEPNEIKKIRNTISKLDSNKIIWNK